MNRIRVYLPFAIHILVYLNYEQHIQGEYYVPVRQMEAIVRLLKRLCLIFLLCIKILYISNGNNIYLLIFISPALQNDLQHYHTIVPTCPKYFGCPVQLGGCA